MNIALSIIALMFAPCVEKIDSVLLQAVDIVSSVKISSDEAGAYSATTVRRSRIEDTHICSVKELSSVAPNFYQPDYGSRMTSSIYVRGFGSRIDQPVVGMNIDEVPVMNKNGYDFELFDIDRIQLMRGAQSSLFGRNTSGGAINIYTLSPLTFQGKRLLVEYGNNNNLRLKASHYAAPSRDFGWSAGVYYSHSDGFFMNRERGEKCDGGDNLSVRMRMQWLPWEGWSFDNSFSVGYTDEGGWAYRQYNSGSLAPVAYNDACSYRRFTVSDGLLVKRRLEHATVSSVTGYTYFNDRMRIDNDFLPLDYFSMGQYQKEHVITQEITVKTENSGAFNLIGGLSAFYKHTEMSAPVRFKQYGIENLILNNANKFIPGIYGPGHLLEIMEDNFVISDDFVIPVYGAAAYFQAELKAGGFALQASLRADYERSSMDYDSRSTVHYRTLGEHPYLPMNTVFAGSNSMDAFELLPGFSLSYNGEWGNMYASARKGFKAGGFNTQLFSDILQTCMMGSFIKNEQDVDASVTLYEPETNWCYELGAHFASLAGGMLDISASLFYIDCRNQQLTVFPKGMSTGRFMSNAGKSYSYGAEATATLHADNFRFDASYGYTHAKFVEYTSGGSDYSGKHLPFAPRETVSLNASWRVPVSKEFAQRLVFNVGWNGTGRIYWNEENTLSQSFYGLLNASLAWEKGHFGVSLWGKNLLGERYNTFYFRSIGNDFFAQGKPLQAGITVNVNL